MRSAALTVYSVLKNKAEHEEYPLKEATLAGTLDTSNAASSDALYSKLGEEFVEVAKNIPRRSRSLSWAGEVGKETAREMLEQGFSAGFDWFSKGVFG